MKGLFKIIKFGFASENNRTAKVTKNIIYTALLKFINILISFWLVRVTYNFLGQEDVFGVWLTILSLLSWINFFDMGLGNSLRNKLAESIAIKDLDKGEIYVSTSYAVMGIFILMLLSAYFAVSPFVNWNKAFNFYLINSNELRNLINLMVFFYSVYFFLSLIKGISLAFQDALLPSLLGVMSNVMFLTVLFILYKFNMSGIIILGATYSVILIFVLVVSSGYLFWAKYKSIRPRLNCIKIAYAPNLFNLGIKFFIIQIAVLIVFATDNMIITQVLGPAYVTPYQIAYKLFSVFIMAANIILTPLWSAYTDAYARGEYDWITKTIKKQLCLMAPLLVGILFMILLSKQVIFLWMGDKIQVPFLLIVLMGIYTIILVWNNIFAYLFNGIGKIKSLIIGSVIVATINIPLSVYCAKYLGVSGVILATIASLSVGALVEPVKYYYVFYSKSKIKFLDKFFCE